MMTATMKDRIRKADHIAQVRAQLADVMADLSTMGQHKAGTEWHTDRVREAQWLTRELERLVY